jgi:hypothetical protein
MRISSIEPEYTSPDLRASRIFDEERRLGMVLSGRRAGIPPQGPVRGPLRESRLNQMSLTKKKAVSAQVSILPFPKSISKKEEKKVAPLATLMAGAPVVKLTPGARPEGSSEVPFRSRSLRFVFV